MKKTAFLPILLCLGFAGSQNSFAALMAYDDAAQSAYNDGWQSGDNGGTGWGAWTFSTSPNAGFFVGNSAANAGGSSGNINTSGNAWGMYANSGSLAAAVRPMIGNLSVGQSVILLMDNGYIESGGTVGIGLQNGSGINRFEFYFSAGKSSYTLDVNGAQTPTGIGFTGNGLQLMFTQNSGNGFSLDVLTGGNTSHFSGTLSASDISQIRFFNSNAGNFGDRDAFFNGIQVVPEPVTTALGIVIGLFILARIHSISKHVSVRFGSFERRIMAVVKD